MNTLLKPVMSPPRPPKSGSHTPLAFDVKLPLEQGLPARRGDPESKYSVTVVVPSARLVLWPVISREQ
jgi:hypothetical protein